jgi:hypothetical protein
LGRFGSQIIKSERLVGKRSVNDKSLVRKQESTHLVALMQQFDQPPISDSRKALALERMDAKQENLKHLDVDDPPDAMYDVLNFFESVSLLTNKGYLDKEMV